MRGSIVTPHAKGFAGLWKLEEERKHAEYPYVGLSSQPGDLAPAARGENETAIALPGLFADVDFADAKESHKGDVTLFGYERAETHSTLFS